MKPFANRRVSRNTAFAMLLVWLFALGSGVANACLLEAHRNRANGSPVAHSHQAGKGHEGIPAAHAGAIETHAALPEGLRRQLHVAGQTSTCLRPDRRGAGSFHRSCVGCGHPSRRKADPGRPFAAS
jgi:hypothetical protein